MNIENSKIEYTVRIERANGEIQEPIVEGDVTVKWTRDFRAGIMELKVVKDDELNFQEGDRASLSVNGKLFFLGFIFKKQRDKRQIIKLTCYDQIRYLKNKDTYQYKEMSVSELIRKICEDRGLKVGTVEDSGYKVPKKIEENQEYMQMIKAADDINLSQTGDIYTLFDDKGEICYKKPTSMIVDYPLTYDNAVDFDYVTSIDDGTYNRIVVYITDDNGNQVRQVVKEDREAIRQWGILEYTVKTNNDEDIENKASQLLELFNRKFRSFKVKQVIGNVNIRAGSLLPVRMMKIGDININSYMIVDSITHKFHDGNHFMDLDLQNKDIMPIGSGDGIIQDNQKNQMFHGFGNGKAPVQASSKQLQSMLDSAYSHLGDKYSQSKRGQKGYSDCSYFVWQSMRDAGFNVPSRAWSTSSMVSSGCFQEIPFSEVKAGDVAIKPKGRNGGGHTVIALGKDKIIHQTPPQAKVSNMGKYQNYKWYRVVK